MGVGERWSLSPGPCVVLAQGLAPYTVEADDVPTAVTV